MCLEITIINDTVLEPELETFEVNISTEDPSVDIDPDTSVVTIVDNDRELIFTGFQLIPHFCCTASSCIAYTSLQPSPLSPPSSTLSPYLSPLLSSLLPLLSSLVVVIGFDQESYPVSEDDGTVTVCASIQNPVSVQDNVIVTVTFTTADGDAECKSVVC